MHCMHVQESKTPKFYPEPQPPDWCIVGQRNIHPTRDVKYVDRR